MVPMARILVVGVVFIAAPCAFAELKPTRQPISASAAARANFMLSPFCVSLRRPGEPEACSQPSRPTTPGTPVLRLAASLGSLAPGLWLHNEADLALAAPVAPA